MRIQLAIASLILLFAVPALGQTKQQNLMKTCNADAKEQGLTGDKRKSFMSDCLSGKTETKAAKKSEKSAKGKAGDDDDDSSKADGKSKKPSDAQLAQRRKMTTCNASAKKKGLEGDKRKTFMSECLSGGGF